MDVINLTGRRRIETRKRCYYCGKKKPIEAFKNGSTIKIFYNTEKRLCEDCTEERKPIQNRTIAPAIMARA